MCYELNVEKNFNIDGLSVLKTKIKNRNRNLSITWTIKNLYLSFDVHLVNARLSYILRDGTRRHSTAVITVSFLVLFLFLDRLRLKHSNNRTSTILLLLQ